MEQTTLQHLVSNSIEAQNKFRTRWEHFPQDESVRITDQKAESILRMVEERLQENYPFFHPRYAGQMLKPPHEIAVAAYLMAMQINPNNHALDGGPATAKMENEAVKAIATMFGYERYLGHLTSSGTIANLEALWIAKSIHPEKAIAFSTNAHYTHGRMCSVIGAKHVVLESFDDIEGSIVAHNVGTIVVTIGTTSVGGVEPLEKILPIAQKHNVRIHIDAAYGGFFMILANSSSPAVDPVPFRLIKECDSIVVDPHKHAMQPYGCGCILFKNPDVGKYYKHDSPYTYFTSSELHLGEISLECSRAGAAAAALWATLQYFPLQLDHGLGTVLLKTRNAALKFSGLLKKSAVLREYTAPDLDIVTFFPQTRDFSASAVSSAVDALFFQLMNDPANPLFLATLLVPSHSIQSKYPDFRSDIPTTKIFRSVLMKPEHESFVQVIVGEIESTVLKYLSQNGTK